MALDPYWEHLARRQHRADCERHKNEFLQRKAALLGRCSRLGEIEGEVRLLMSHLAMVAVQGGPDGQSVQDKILAIRKRNDELQEERRKILTDLHLPEDFLTEKPLCPKCGDRGYVDGEMCSCLKKYYMRLQSRELSGILDSGDAGFEKFSLDWYPTERDRSGISPRQNAERVYRCCREFAEKFGQKYANLLIAGRSGLGKTFLAICIVREVNSRGFTVEYGSVDSILAKMSLSDRSQNDADSDWDDTGCDQGKGQFSAAAAAENRILNCDLLVMDDLGAETISNAGVSSLYRIINTRIMGHRSTILISRLSKSELSSRYTPQIISRIMGEYIYCPMTGNDIRPLKKAVKDMGH